MINFVYSYYIGLSIQCDELRLLKLKIYKKRLSIAGFNFSHIPLGAIEQGKVVDSDLLTNTISKLVQATGSKGCSASIAIPNSQVITQRVKLPLYLTQEECLFELNNHLEEYLPLNDESLNINFVRDNSNLQETNEGILIAARKKQIDICVNACIKAGLCVKAVDINLYALARLNEMLSVNSKPIVILDLEISMAHIIILIKEKVIFSHHFTYQMDEFIQKTECMLQIAMANLKINEITKIYFSGTKKVTELVSHIFKKNVGLNLTEYPLLENDLFSFNQIASSYLPNLLVPLGLALKGVKWLSK